MEIYKLVRREKAEEETPATEKDELKAARMTLGELPSGLIGRDVAEGEAEAAAGNKSKFTLDNEQEEPTVIVKIDGPLGRAFTAVLNKTLALESLYAMALTPGQLSSLQATQPEVPVVNIMVMDEAALSMGDVDELSDMVDRQEDQEFVLAVESSGAYRITTNNSAKALGLSEQKKNAFTCGMMSQAVGEVVRIAKGGKPCTR